VIPWTESRLICWQMTPHPLHQQPKPSTGVATLMTDECEW